MGVYEITLFDLKPQRSRYEFLVQIKVMDFSLVFTNLPYTAVFQLAHPITYPGSYAKCEQGNKLVSALLSAKGDTMYILIVPCLILILVSKRIRHSRRFADPLPIVQKVTSGTIGL